MLAQLCSQIVSLFLFCVSFNFACFAENTPKIGVSAQKKQKKTKKNNKLLKLKIVFFLLFLAYFSKILFFLQGERDF